jgi:hypothetical protein
VLARYRFLFVKALCNEERYFLLLHTTRSLYLSPSSRGC